MSPPINHGRYWGLIRALLVGLFVCRGLVYLGVLPIFEGWDEYQHLGYVVHVLETGQPAVLGQTNVPLSFLRELVKFPVPKRVAELQLGPYGVVDYKTFWSDELRPAPRPGALPLYESQHSWWYYRLCAPLFSWLGGVANLPKAVGGLRLLNLGFVAAAVWLALGVVGKVVRERRDATLIGLVIAVHPLFLINGVRVANDALGVMLATTVIALCFTLNGSQGIGRGVVVGLVAGFAILVKAVNFGLFPFVALAWISSAYRNRLSNPRAILGGAALALALLAVIQGEVRSNLRRYGGLTTMQEAVRNRQEGRTKVDLIQTARSFRWDVRVRQLWLSDSFLVGGWSRQRPERIFANFYSWIGAAGLFGAAFATAGFFKRTEPVLDSRLTVLLCASLCVSFTGALAYHMVQSKLAWGEPTTCPWYASATFPWYLVIVTAGGLSWPVIAPLRTLIPLALTVTCLGAEWVVIWSRMIPTYSGGITGLPALQRLASLQAPVFGTATIIVAELGVLLFACLVLAIALGSQSDMMLTSPSITNEEK
ncbi:glycosyltransferase family 39 protein [Singulisphaera acidiphila]|uniref:Uncharacterized protein n=1 Tax=Singulisphaera acidiphila (strain ATCC BAA-1392 / DSM 18658 / VKM B-2454 / MOB10) TaxID=886293 RepID=L0DMA2_SINAD|nr:glycosyltransferase family 39 protein [Singulisphaera acidiphila]AGA29973.1 hypothetical protein Sinac_5852 [Singulisphaera acidiphila DSM 18658]